MVRGEEGTMAWFLLAIILMYIAWSIMKMAGQSDERGGRK
jgi:hypothetical protein